MLHLSYIMKCPVIPAIIMFLPILFVDRELLAQPKGLAGKNKLHTRARTSKDLDKNESLYINPSLLADERVLPPETQPITTFTHCLLEEPRFPGDINTFITQHLRYPDSAKARGEEGRVFIQFVVGKDGAVRDVQIIRGVYPELNKEALRFVQSMPCWQPVKRPDGTVLDVAFTLPVIFRLD